MPPKAASGGLVGQCYRVGVIGGSIAGCATAIGLARLGHDVTVFERSTRGLTSRGAGIGTPTTVLDSLAQRDFIAADFPRFAGKPFRWLTRDETDPGGRVLGEDPMPLPVAALNWIDLFEALRLRVTDDAYRLGSPVVGIVEAPATASIVLEDGTTSEFDLVVCADGYRSLGRARLFPDCQSHYRGYVLWRGIVAENQAPRCAVLEEGIVRAGYAGGHGIFYLVPGPYGALEPGTRRVNWGLYRQVTDNELGEVLTDRVGKVGDGSVAVGMVSPEREIGFKREAASDLPGTFADVVGSTRDIFIQAIFTVEVPSYYSGRVCLVGDAGSLFPPFTGSGVFKAMSNATDLADALAANETIDEALAAWNHGQLGYATTLGRAAASFEQSYIFSMPDVAAMSAEAFASWNRGVWTRAMSPASADQ